jgi:DNA polymerase-3 subunit gamma/tau
MPLLRWCVSWPCSPSWWRATAGTGCCAWSANRSTSGTRERLRAALEAAGLAQDISVELGPVSDSPALRNTARQNARQERALEVVQNDPFVQTLVREFDARIVPGSVPL